MQVCETLPCAAVSLWLPVEYPWVYHTFPHLALSFFFPAGLLQECFSLCFQLSSSSSQLWNCGSNSSLGVSSTLCDSEGWGSPSLPPPSESCFLSLASSRIFPRMPHSSVSLSLSLLPQLQTGDVWAYPTPLLPTLFPQI